MIDDDDAAAAPDNNEDYDVRLDNVREDRKHQITWPVNSAYVSYD